LLALQIQAVADTALIISYRPEPLFARENLFALHDRLAMLFCVATALFACMFGTQRERHRGLLMVLAMESLIKMFALLAVGYFALQQVLGGFHGVEKWLSLHPEQLETLYSPIGDRSSHMLVILFFSTAIVLPQMFHVGLAENTKLKTLHLASWGMPLYLLCLSLPVLPILWAGFELGTAVTPEYFTLGVPMAAGQTGLAAFAYLGGLAAAVGTTVALAVALSTMCLNHWVMPLYRPIAGAVDLYSWITGLRRVLMALVIVGGYAFYRSLQNGQTLTDLVILSLIGSLQFLPGAFAVLYGPRANRQGLIAGLIAGMGLWVCTLLLPSLLGWRLLLLPWDMALRLGVENWSQLTALSIGVNIALFVLVSYTTRMSEDEQRIAEQCATDDAIRPLHLALDVHSANDMRERLEPTLGADVAAKEIQRALDDLSQSESDTRPYALRRLRDRLEANLSGLMGAGVAHALMDRVVPYHTASNTPQREDLHLIESRISQYRYHLTGLASEVDKLRRHHRQMLESLPMAVCSLSPDGEVTLWNRSMVELTGIGTDAAFGAAVKGLPVPWGALIDQFSCDTQTHVHKQTVEVAGRTRWLSLHKADLSGALADGWVSDSEGYIIMIDDLTETQQLERELLHSERLASIGRLAAGVAHEIGNPVTGIACLAQDLGDDEAQPAVRETAAQILGQTERISRIVQSLVHFAHAGKAGDDAQTTVDIFECVEEAIHLLSLQKNRARMHFNNLLAPDTVVQGNEQTLTQLFINLLSNASDASPPDSAIDISAERSGEQWKIQVRDYGCGISAEHIARIFEPFFTTKPAGHGTGLGLALVYSIVEDHGGHIDVKSPVDHHAGTAFIITLPAL
jgi:PAS domain S-box-containing protein